MKFLLKLFLFLSILLAAVYATTPLWMSYVLTNQLSPGWRLEKLETGYPGFSGINIEALHLKGSFQTTELAIEAIDVHFSYREMKTRIDSVLLDVYLVSAASEATETFTLDDLSLPVTRLTGKMPALDIKQMDLALHQDESMWVSGPLLIHFHSLKLTPRANDGFVITSTASLEASPGTSGNIEADVTPNLIQAGVRFPGQPGSPPWLTVQFVQKLHAANNTTSIQAAFITESADLDWLDPLLNQITGGTVSHVEGALDLSAVFAGQEQRKITQLSLVTEKLLVVSDKGTLDLKARVLVSRDHEKVIVNLPAPTEIQFQDETGWVDELITGLIPNLQRLPRLDSQILLRFTPNSSFVFEPVIGKPASFGGGIRFGLSSSGEVFDLMTDKLNVEIESFPGLKTTSAEGVVALNWTENTPFTWSFGDTKLESEKMSVAATISSQNGKLVSNGNAIFESGLVPLFSISTNRIDTSWRDLDMLDMTGSFGTKTQGFTFESNGEVFSDFDFDVSYDLLSNAGISGLGTLGLDSGPVIPLEFSGNLDLNHWNIKIPATTISMLDLTRLLPVAHIYLPAPIKLTDGHINVQGNVKMTDEITAKLTVSGDQLAASMRKSSASKASFNFDAGYGQHLFASGPISVDNIAIAAGIDLSQITADLNLESTETVTLQNMQADVFDGQLNLGKFRYADSRIEDTTVQLNHINLGQLLAYVDADGLEGTGSLDFTLPVGSDQTGIYVRNGTFKSVGPGYLAYTKEGVAGGNIGLQALENFQYQDLSGTIDYQPTGEYQIAIHLEGKNPDLYGGHPISFNLNINGALPSLFEALFMTGSFEERILQGFKIER